MSRSADRRIAECRAAVKSARERASLSARFADNRAWGAANASIPVPAPDDDVCPHSRRVSARASQCSICIEARTKPDAI